MTIIGPRAYLGVDDMTADDQPLTVGTQLVTTTSPPETIAADTMVLNTDVPVTGDGFLVRVAAWLQGNQLAGGAQVLRGVIYDSAGSLVAAGEEVSIAPDRPAGWVTLPFDAVIGAPLAAGTYHVGFHAGPVSNGAEFFAVVAGESNTYPAPYAAGPPQTLPAGTPAGADAALFLEVVPPLPTPSNVTDDFLASIPFDMTQGVFRASAPIKASARSATCGWYGTSFDPTNGANAIVRANGPLSDLVGERILVTRRDARRDRSVAVYVHNELNFPAEIADEDLVLSARAFLAIGSWTLDSLPVRVAILG